MSDRKGNPDKQPKECRELGSYKMACPNLKEIDLKNMNGETYDCAVCGEHFYLDYDEMR